MKAKCFFGSFAGEDPERLDALHVLSLSPEAAGSLAWPESAVGARSWWKSRQDALRLLIFLYALKRNLFGSFGTYFRIKEHFTVGEL